MVAWAAPDQAQVWLDGAGVVGDAPDIVDEISELIGALEDAILARSSGAENCLSRQLLIFETWMSAGPEGRTY